jgi:uncharacterized protein YycO
VTVTNTAHLKPGEYICVRTTGPAAALIALVTRSRYTHVAIVAELGFAIEAEPGGVRLASLTEYDGCLMICNAAEPTTITQRAAVLAYATAQLGQPYNWDADLVDGLEHLGWRWRFLTRFAKGRKAVMCSQLVAAAGVSAGLAGWQCGKPTASAVVPGDLAARIENRAW